MQEARYLVTIRVDDKAWVHAAKIKSYLQDADKEKAIITARIACDMGYDALHFEEIPTDDYTDALHYEYDITVNA